MLNVRGLSREGNEKEFAQDYSVYPIDSKRSYRKAGPTDLIRLLPAPGANSLFIQKWVLEAFFTAIVRHEFSHLSGPTGSAKTSLIEALHGEQQNVKSLCQGLGIKQKPFALHAVEMAIFDTPGELIQRRAIKNGSTFDEESRLVASIRKAVAGRDDAYSAVWLREMGRVHSASIQGGLLDLMTMGQILLPSGERIQGHGISWIADSNYQAEDDSVHTLVTFDDALRRRFTVNLTLDYPPMSQETVILKCLMDEGQLPPVDEDTLTKVVKLGWTIRRQREEGKLQSVPPPTIYGYMACIRMADALPHHPLQQVATSTLLGNASNEDRKLSNAALNEVFGLQADSQEDPDAIGNMF